MTTQWLHAPSYNPLFDQLVAEVGPATATATATTTATTPTTSPTTPAKPSGRRAARVTPIDAHRIAVQPLKTSGLTRDEQDVVSEMGGTVARLILQMLDNAPLDRKTAALATALR